MKLERDGFLLIEYEDTSNTFDVWGVNNQIFAFRQAALRESSKEQDDESDQVKANTIFYAKLRELWTSFGFSPDASDFTLNQFATAIAEAADALQKKTLSRSPKPDALPASESDSSIDPQPNEQP